MSYFPLFVELEGKTCLILGGGNVAFRRCLALREFGSDVEILAPNISPDLARHMAKDDGIFWLKRSLKLGDDRFISKILADKALVVAASNDSAINRLLASSAIKEGIPVSVADDPSASSFLFPATVRRGTLCAGITSGGSSPSLVKNLQISLEAAWPNWLCKLSVQMQELRKHVLICSNLSKKDRRAILDEVVAQAMFQQGPLDPQQFDTFIARLVENEQTGHLKRSSKVV